MLNNPQFAFSLLKSGPHEVDNKTLSESWKIAPSPSLLFR